MSRLNNLFQVRIDLKEVTLESTITHKNFNNGIPISSLESLLFTIGLVCSPFELSLFESLFSTYGLRCSEYSNKIFGRMACRIL